MKHKAAPRPTDRHFGKHQIPLDEIESILRREGSFAVLPSQVAGRRYYVARLIFGLNRGKPMIAQVGETRDEAVLSVYDQLRHGHVNRTDDPDGQPIWRVAKIYPAPRHVKGPSWGNLTSGPRARVVFPGHRVDQNGYKQWSVNGYGQ